MSAKPKAPATSPARKLAKPAPRRRTSAAEPVASQDPPCDCASNKALGLPANLSRKAPAAPATAAAAGAEKASAWRAAKSLLRLREQVNAKAPGRKKGSDGTIGDDKHRTRNSDHNAWVDGNVVTALDITHDPARGCDVDKLAEAIRAAKDKRVKYIIWNKRICNHAKIGATAAWAWRKYSGTNPHTAHIHISVKATKAHYDDTTDWPTGL